jgi:glutathione S-transferase
MVDLGDTEQRDAFRRLWPIGKFPVLEDGSRGETVPESTIIIEYLEQHYPGTGPMLPQNPELALRTRMLDRFIDLYIHLPMQRIVGDRLRPEENRDPYGVGEARQMLGTALGILDQDMCSRKWANDSDFSLADCAAAPALFYADKVTPLASQHPNIAAYLERLMQRPSYARVLTEAQPYFHMFPA